MALTPNIPSDAQGSTLVIPEVVVYANPEFKKPLFRTNVSINYMEPSNDKISSIIVISGTWEFYEHSNYRGAKVSVKPGYYPYVDKPPINFPDNTISSVKVISFYPQGMQI